MHIWQRGIVYLSQGVLLPIIRTFVLTDDEPEMKIKKVLSLLYTSNFKGGISSLWASAKYFIFYVERALYNGLPYHGTSHDLLWGCDYSCSRFGD